MPRTAADRDEWLDQLPDTFSHALAADLGLSDWALARLRDEGFLEQPGRGWYSKLSTATADPDLLAIAARTPAATLCLRSALARHGLSDDIPTRIDIALPAGTRPPNLALPIAWHRFDASTFDTGRELLDLGGGNTIGLYSPERCIIDAFRMRRLEGPELGNQALKRWLLRPGSQPAQLLALAASFPGAQRPMRAALEILL
jgi:hypothetical protein